MLIDKLTLKSRLIITVAIPCLALIFVGLASLNAMSVMASKTQEMYLNTAAPMRAVAEAASRIPRMRVGIDMMLLQETSLRDAKGVKTRVKETREEDIPEMRDALNLAVSTQVNPELKAQVQRLLNDFEKMVSTELNPLLEALDKDDTATAQKIYKEKYAVTYGTMRKDANTLLETLLAQAESQNKLSHDSYISGRTTQIIIISAGLIISFIISSAIVMSLRKRVSTLRDTITTAAQDMSLNTRIKLDGKDELTEIGDSFNLFMEKVHSAINQVAENSRQLAVMARDVSERARHTQSNCTSQRDRTVQVATAIHELGATVSEIAANAAQAADAANEATHQSSDGQKVVMQAREQIGALSLELQKATNVVESLAKQVNDISSTLDTIRNISDQTNLLALNAAIEAARAGDQGRGFAVVADEVRTLASRSANSTEEIQQVIDKLQSESKRAVEAMQQGREQSDRVVEYADNATSALEQINSHIDQISGQNIQVATATEEQSTVVEDINRNVEEINHLTTETTDIAMQLNQSSNSLQQLSSQLDKLVGNFKL
ncbi:methyl-accepting chemotaxis protein [Vibrio diazotrophicus]|uniref:methyl-accepting chemotaxis protein n=1 Tax=Vibrio diazotrophicus TaxID=685 RepID=UPI000C9E46E0|nr:methyl-accepting chemotaxis protein [Vibrio diazotrophicus]MCZ4370201.1 methyl-accepting chemotaxis protein [Vibrio diazotrophicus]PNH78637.1 methyl-accepting chemotaxis protein [Vibrio diazotrophicus]